MVNYKLSSGGQVQDIQFPTRYADLTYEQFYRLRTEYTGDVGQLLDILTGVPRAIWMNLSVNEANKITEFLQWIVNDPIKWDELTRPTKLTIRGQEFEIPKDLGLETFGQKILMEAKVSAVVNAMLQPPAKRSGGVRNLTPDDIKKSAQRKHATQLITIIPYLVACYMQPRVTGKELDEAEITALEFEVMKCKAVEVYPIGNFFTRILLGSAKSGQTRSQQIRQSLKAGNYKKGPVLKKSKRKPGTS